MSFDEIDMNTAGDALPQRCADYLKAGPPPHMTNYVPGSLTEIIIAHGARSQPLDPELREIGGIVLREADSFSRISDETIRSYMQQGVDLVAEVLEANE